MLLTIIEGRGGVASELGEDATTGPKSLSCAILFCQVRRIPLAIQVSSLYPGSILSPPWWYPYATQVLYTWVLPNVNLGSVEFWCFFDAYCTFTSILVLHLIAS